MQEEHDTPTRILRALRFRPKGMTITEVAKQIGTTRNSVSKHLEILQIAGKVDVRITGNAKLYSLAQRVPLSAFLCFTRNLIVVLDKDLHLLQINDRYLHHAGYSSEEDLIGRRVDELALPVLSTPTALNALSGADKEQVIDEIRCVRDGREEYYRMQVIPTVFEAGDWGWTVVIDDITKRIRAEEELRASEERFRMIVQDQTDLICRFLPGGTITFANRAACDYFGLEEEELQDENLHSFVVPEDWNRIRDAVGSLSRDRPAFTLELRVWRKAASAPGDPDREEVRWQIWTVRAIYDDRGTLVEYQGTGRDITENRKLEERKRRYMRNMEFLARTAMEFADLPPYTDVFHYIAYRTLEIVPGSRIAVLSYDEAEHTLLVRAVADSVFRDEIASLIGREPEGIVLPMDETLLSSAFPGDLKPVTHLGIKEYPIRQGGEDVGISLFDLCLRQIPEETCERIRRRCRMARLCTVDMIWQGHQNGVVGIFLQRGDVITDEQALESFVRQASIALRRRQVEDQLRRSERRFRDVVDSSPIPAAIIEGDGRYLYCNRKFTETFGYTLEDIPTGRAWFQQAFPDEKERKEAIGTWQSDRKQAGRGDIRSRTFSVRCKGGERKVIFFRPVELCDGTQYVTYEDVTEERRTYRMLVGEIASLRRE